MCGIAGLYAVDDTIPARSIVQRMAAAIASRGPDGTKIHRQGRVALGHNRLATIDLVTGDQPLHGAEGTTVIANGEIYNYVELKEQPDYRDYPYQTASDCEVVLPVYARHGHDFARQLRGMYAVCIVDPHNGTMILARDQFGMKPLYYSETAQGVFFASEIKGLLVDGLPAPRIDRVQVHAVVDHHYTLGHKTVFDGIHRLLPGETLVIRDGRIADRHIRPTVPREGPRPMAPDAALNQLDAVLRDSVSIHCRSDVPIGLFFSGGVDSSSILSILARDYRERLTTFSVGFPGAGVHDERDLARKLSRAAGANHVEVSFTVDDFWATLPQIARYFDDPLIDPAILPTWTLAKVAAQDLKVVLSGEGGDEVFAGYGRYRRPWLRRLKRLMKGGAGGRSYPAPALADPAADYTDLQRLQALDMVDWLPHGLLSKLDKCLMAHGLEGRTPFVDTQVVDFGFRLPDRLKIRGQDGKWLLKTWLHQHMPEAHPFAHKRGFTVPVGEWLASRSRDLPDLVARQPGLRAYFSADMIRSVFANPTGKQGFLAWSYLFFALWHQTYGLGRPSSDGNVFEVLADAARG